MKKGTKIALTISSIILGISAGLFFQYKKFMDFAVKVKGFKINSFRKDNVDIDVKLAFQNNSIFEFTVLDYNIDIILNGKKISNVSSSSKFLLKKKSESIVPVKIKIDLTKIGYSFKDLTNMVIDFMTNKDNLVFEFKGKINVEKGFLKPTIDIDVKNTLKEMLEDDEIKK